METRVQQVRSNPDDIELVREVSLWQVSDWLLSFMGEAPNPLADRIRDLEALREHFSPILGRMQEGDTMWLARSKQRGALYGHEGIALVRNGQPAEYMRVWNH
ncbi:MAG: hypothetical protein ACK4JB_13805 [Reyranella sp.]